jgi:hypothetical protein
MNVALPSGSIGVRGTIVAGRADDVTRASLSILLGDSRAGSARNGPASIEVCNAGACERVATAGFGVRIDGPESPPSPPFLVPTDELETILHALSDPEGIGSGSGEAGQLDQAELPLGDGEHAREIRRKLQGLDALNTLSDRAAQDARTVPEPTPSVTPAPASSSAPPPPTGPSFTP